jgi:hypothetical protein
MAGFAVAVLLTSLSFGFDLREDTINSTLSTLFTVLCPAFYVNGLWGMLRPVDVPPPRVIEDAIFLLVLWTTNAGIYFAIGTVAGRILPDSLSSSARPKIL